MTDLGFSIATSSVLRSPARRHFFLSFFPPLSSTFSRPVNPAIVPVSIPTTLGPLQVNHLGSRSTSDSVVQFRQFRATFTFLFPPLFALHFVLSFLLFFYFLVSFPYPTGIHEPPSDIEFRLNDCVKLKGPSLFPLSLRHRFKRK
ncbi:unnamed protein product [Protopolystoma xenopodis]|uniref:Transmembrane protein n=1 Tax=Protopolystoma xenopodis TaxID=117903 RepID=A0A3S5BE84_9PLAT|nr:unnamed protein product [Protopolystoma xenopodis]